MEDNDNNESKKPYEEPALKKCGELIEITEGQAPHVSGAAPVSARRFKKDVEDMGDASSGLMKLRPVTFRYKPEYAQGLRTLQYGLIAEEVAEVYPDLVQYDPKTGQALTVYYHLVNAMLLNEAQKQQKKIDALEEQVRELSALVARTIRDRFSESGLIQREQFPQPGVQ